MSNWQAIQLYQPAASAAAALVWEREGTAACARLNTKQNNKKEHTFRGLHGHDWDRGYNQSHVHDNCHSKDHDHGRPHQRLRPCPASTVMDTAAALAAANVQERRCLWRTTVG